MNQQNPILDQQRVPLPPAAAQNVSACSISLDIDDHHHLDNVEDIDNVFDIDNVSSLNESLDLDQVNSNPSVFSPPYVSQHSHSESFSHASSLDDLNPQSFSLGKSEQEEKEVYAVKSAHLQQTANEKIQNTQAYTQISNPDAIIPAPPALSKPKEAGVLFPELAPTSRQRSANSSTAATNYKDTDYRDDHYKDTHYKDRKPMSSVVQIIDETASADAICIDDSTEPLESVARAIIKSVGPNAPTSLTEKNKQKNGHRRVGLKNGSGNAAVAATSNGNMQKGSGKVGIDKDDHRPILPNGSFTGNRRLSQSLKVIHSTHPKSLVLGYGHTISKPEETTGSSKKSHIQHDNGQSSSHEKNTGTDSNPDFQASPSADFEDYKRQTASQLLSERRLQRRKQRVLRRRLRAMRKEQYFGNYFQDQDPNVPSNLFDNVEFSHVSYAVDHFNGNRQSNPFYDLYMIPNGYIHNEPTNGHRLHERNQVGSSNASFRSHQTDNIDDMSSDTSHGSNNNVNQNGGFHHAGIYSTHSNLNEGTDYFSSDSSSSDEDGSDFHSSENPKHGLKRKLYSRHLTSIGAASAIGISTMLVAGRTLFIAGPFGALLGFVFTGAILASVIAGYGELVSLIPLHTGITGTISRFVNPSMGYATGFSYWLANAIALPAELTAAAMMLVNYPELADHGAMIVWIIYIFFLILLINSCSVRVYGEFQFIMNLVRIGMIIALTILLIIINTHPLNAPHKVGFLYWSSSKSVPEYGWYYGLFRPLYPLRVVATTQTDSIVLGVQGALGQFLQFWQAVLESSRGYMSVPIVYSSVGEARNPRKSLARATKYIFWQILFFYCLSIFLLGITVYAGNADLYGVSKKAEPVTERLYDMPYYHSNQTVMASCDFTNKLVSNLYTTGLNISPWVIALQSAGFCALANAMNAAFVVFAVSSGSSHLYAASRTLYGMFRMHIEDQKIKTSSWWNMCGWCNEQGIPTYAVIVSFPFSFLALMNIKYPSFTVFQKLFVISGTCALISWMGMAVAFLRFHKAIKLRTKAREVGIDTESQVHTEDLSRNDLAYPFKSPFQPFLAWFGLVGVVLIITTMGFNVFIKGNWCTSEFVQDYISLLLFCIVYLVHRIYTGIKTLSAEDIDLDSGRKELDRAEWVEDRKYSYIGIYAIWRWMLGRVRFIGVLFKTLQGDYNEAEDTELLSPKKRRTKRKNKKRKKRK